MADFGGFKLETLEETRARINQELAAGINSRDQTTRIVSNNRRILYQLFGSPEERRAERNQKAVGKAIADAEAALPEDATTFQRQQARMKASADALAALGDNAQSASVYSDLLKLEQAEEDRQRLIGIQSRDEEERTQRMAIAAAAEARAKQKAEREAATDGLYYVMPDINSRPTMFDTNVDSEREAFEQATAASPGAIVVSAKDYWDFISGIEKEKAKPEKGGGLTPTSRVKFIEKADAVVDFSHRVMQAEGILRRNPRALQTFGQGGAEADQAWNNLIGVIDAGRDALIEGLSYGDSAELRRKDEQVIEKILKEQNITNSGVRSLILSMAYALARAQDPSGRLSDADVQSAVQQLAGANTDPDAMIAVFHNIMNQQIHSLENAARSRSLLDPGTDYNSLLTPAQSMYDEWNSRVSYWNIDPFGKQPPKNAARASTPVASGAPATPASTPSPDNDELIRQTGTPITSAEGGGVVAGQGRLPGNRGRQLTPEEELQSLEDQVKQRGY